MRVLIDFGLPDVLRHLQFGAVSLDETARSSYQIAVDPLNDCGLSFTRAHKLPRQEKRRCPRLDVSAHVFVSSLPGSVDGTLLNLSRNGALVQLERELPVDNHEVEVFLPSLNGDMVGLLTYVRRIEAEHTKSRVAVQFQNFSRADRQALEGLFALLLPARTPQEERDRLCATVLEPVAHDAVVEVADEVVSDRLTTILSVCGRAFESADGMQLSRHQDIEDGAVQESLLTEAARFVDNIRDCMDELFSLAELDAGENPGLARLHQIIAPLVGMLSHEVDRFSRRLAGPNWLAELHKVRGKTCQCFDAVALLVLRWLGVVGRPEKLLRRHGDVLREAIALRRAVFELAYDLGDLRRRLRETPDRVAAIRGEIRERVDRFAMSAEYRLMRAHDKREVSAFRMSLHNCDVNAPDAAAALSRLNDGFVCFLEALRSINQRMELREHDRYALADLFEGCSSCVTEKDMFVAATPLFGLDAELDEWLQAARTSTMPPSRFKQVASRVLAQG
ncbi:MAG: hypothetical protein A2289_09755 [Deltaproteobacteria bacterium RIFOXYA12_FULL_58_15]|nr:MAG: hypothetical protein A2289_09755 [Deltaproteobacteria bacterium RIFOXYA12_FULL_58_15]OGR08753.1 MAG: hypothetical protein A2341_13715 [Deltaproteobacteria bacterium RIFOXYB12_FULL_58_9]